MEFGLFSNSRRYKRATHEQWAEDLREIEVADKLGFEEAWISKHDSPAARIRFVSVCLSSMTRWAASVY